jgi:transposase
VAACRQPGVSLASVALARGLNANLLRRWVVDAEVGTTRLPATEPSARFVPVRVTKSAVAKTDRAPRSDPPIRIELRKDQTQVIIEWPVTQPAACVVWLKELLG